MDVSRKELAGLAPHVTQAVTDAGRIILANWNKPSDVRRKGRIDLVTETDLAVEDALKESLSRILPGSTFLAEESATDLNPGDLCWIIDPVDGTTNFAHRVHFVGTSVALWCGGRSVLGVINAPVLGELFWAGLGLGAYLGDERIRVSGVDALEDALVATGFPYSVREDLDALMRDLSRVLAATQGLRRPGAAAIDLAYTAAGRFDAFYEVGLKPWDTAAGWLLVEEAGGTISQYDPDRSYHLGARSILASNGLLHARMASLLDAGAA